MRRATGVGSRLQCCAGALLLVLTAAGLRAAEPAATMQSDAERASETAAGIWQGNWRVLRDDPRVRTRAGAEALRLHVIHDAGSDRAEVQWIAGRAICADPAAEPCEWIGQTGAVQAWVGAHGLYAVLPVAADAANPFVLHLARAQRGTSGALFDAYGELRYRVELTAE